MQDLFGSSTVILNGVALIVQALLMLPSLFSDNKFAQCGLHQLVLLCFYVPADIIAYTVYCT